MRSTGQEPTDEIDWPADLPAGIETVVIVDDEPNPHHTLRVHPPDDPTRLALVVFDQLALCEDPSEAWGRRARDVSSSTAGTAGRSQRSSMPIRI
jgi:hypothetical protein